VSQVSTPKLIASYRLLSWRQALAFPLSAAGVVLLLYLIIGCVEPRLELTCDRSEGSASSCRVSERTFVSEVEPKSLDLATTRFDVERVKSGSRSFTRLRISMLDGAPAFETRLKNAPALNVAREVNRFVANPSQKTLQLDEGFSGTFFLVLLPFMVLVSLGPVWGLGGQLLVNVSSNQLAVTRQRWGWRQERAAVFQAGQRPTLELRRLGGRYRHQGRLLARAPGSEPVVLIDSALYDFLERVQRDTDEYYSSANDVPRLGA
jgi:hypothetical protein